MTEPETPYPRAMTEDEYLSTLNILIIRDGLDPDTWEQIIWETAADFYNLGLEPENPDLFESDCPFSFNLDLNPEDYN
jgi:hypothetical protein